MDPKKFRTAEKFWFAKGSRNVNTPERSWLKKTISEGLATHKVSPTTTYYGLVTDKEVSIKESIIRLQLETMDNKRLVLRGTNKQSTDVFYQSVFAKLLSNEIMLTMKDRVKNETRKRKRENQNNEEDEDGDKEEDGEDDDGDKKEDPK